MALGFETVIVIFIIIVVSVSFILGIIYMKYRTSIPFVIAGSILAGGVMGVVGAIIAAAIDFELIPMLLEVGVLVPLVLGLILLVIRYFTTPLDSLVKHSHAVTQKDLTYELPRITRDDEFGTALRGFATMVESLRDALNQTANASLSLSNFTQEMASSAEEVNASSEEISSISQQMSRGAQQQTEQINSALGRSEHLNKMFGENIESIKTASELIEGISGQVNMLALNASIEAARAGEYGRGFAVVADNIRRLADETKQSVIHVNQTITDLKTSMENSILDITKAIQNVAAISEETAAGAEEASAATEEQAATMEEMSATAQEMAQIATRLESLVKQFKLPEAIA